MSIFSWSAVVSADFPHARAMQWMLMAAAVAVATPADAATRARVVRPGAFDGTWNVTFTPQAGNCHASNTVPFYVYGTRVSSAGGGRVTGGVSRNGIVSVTITLGASRASGSGTLPRNAAAARWSGIITGDRCAGSWVAAPG